MAEITGMDNIREDESPISILTYEAERRCEPTPSPVPGDDKRSTRKSSVMETLQEDYVDGEHRSRCRTETYKDINKLLRS
jgi:hypothetical protein